MAIAKALAKEYTDSRIIDIQSGGTGGISYYICSSSEYNSSKVPTVSNPDTNTIYITPTADGANGMFNLYNYKAHAWNLIKSVELEVSAVQVDNTLTVQGKAADAKKVGDELATVKDALSDLDVETDKTLTVEDKPADAKAVRDLALTFDLEFDKEAEKIFLTLNGERVGLGVDVSGLINPDAVNVDDLLIYFRSNVLDAVKHVQSMPKNTVHHVCVTDLHYNTNKRHSAAVCNLLMDSGLFDKLLILGDITDDNTQAQYDNFIADGWGNHNGEIVFALGNHDIRTPSDGYPTYADFYSDFLSKAPYGDADTLSYVYTDTTHGIKYVVINTETITVSESDPQIQMIMNAVSDPNWTVFVLGHRNLGVLPDGITWSQSIGTGLTNAIKTAIESGSATLGGYICGHQHVDIFTPVDDKFYHVTLLNDRFETQNYYDGYSVTSRPVGTIDEHAISIISINSVSCEVEVYRIGAAYSKRNWKYTYARNSGALPAPESDYAISVGHLLSTKNKNSNHFVDSGDGYSSVLIPESGYDLGSARIQMDGTDITADALDRNNIDIPSVTGDVTIDAFSQSVSDNVIIWERCSNSSGNGALTIDKANNYATWETPGSNRGVCFAINGVKEGDYYEVDFTPDTGYETEYGCKVNVNSNILSNANVTNDPELTKVNIGRFKRGVRIPDGMQTLKATIYRPGVITVKKRKVVYNEELFREDNVEVYCDGDATCTFNSDGTVTIGGTKPPTFSDNTNKAIFVLRDLIVNASYHIRIRSDAPIKGGISLYATDTEGEAIRTNGSVTGSKAINNSISITNYDSHYVNNPGTSVLGKGSMQINLSPNATYTISVMLDDPDEV